MSKKTIIKPDPKVLEFLSRASDLVAELPGWKQGVLEASSKAFNDTPRPPVAHKENKIDKERDAC